MHSVPKSLVSLVLLASVIFDLSCAAPAPSPANGSGGSKCPNTNCSPSPVGTTCTSDYNREDGCCPVWTCANGQTAYGKSSASSGVMNSISSFSIGSAPALPGFPAFPGFPSFGGGGGGFPFFGRR